MRRTALALVATVLSSAACSSGRGDDAGDDDTQVPEPDGGSDGGPGPAEAVVCPEAVPAPSDGVCDVVAGQGEAVFLRGVVLLPDAAYQHGGVLIEDGAITCTGCDCASAASAANATRIDCGGGVISPGLINAHQHLTFEEGAPIDHGATRYDHRHEWRGGLPAPSNPNGTDGNRWGELRQMLGGATSIVGSGRADGLVRNLDQPGPADEAAGIAAATFDTFPLGDGGEQFRADCGWNYKHTELEASEFAAYLPHVAEGIDGYAAEEFRCESSSFDGGQDFTEANASHIHAIGLDASGYYEMAANGTRLIWSPRSNISLYGVTAGVQIFDALGGVVALGTDWSYSGSATVTRELACADQYNREQLAGYFSDRALWQMATHNAAIATGTDGRLGDLAVGALGDVAVFAAAPDESYRAVLEATQEDVALVLRGGQVLYGEADVVAALDATCEEVDVCGAGRRLCARREFGIAYGELASITSGSYPAILCGVPADEPTCAPSRPGEFDGATADDGDGDGVADAADGCPTVFDPIRPIDQGVQADVDGDGIGDACDETPVGDDLDGDGAPNAADNCPRTANDGQIDADADGKGDACDFCPDSPNPTTVCGLAPPATVSITAIQDGTVTAGTRVAVEGAVVTGVWASGVWVQMPAGGPHSGINVFTGGAPGVVVGDVVSVTGKVVEYFDDTEIDDADVTKTGTGTPIAPVALTVAQASDEQYEGVLVTLTDAATVENPYDCHADSAMCGDTALYELNDAIVVWNRLYRDADWTAQLGKKGVTGVMTYRFARRRILPRGAADLTP